MPELACWEEMTFDAGKRRRGRKQGLAVDTMGLIHAVDVIPAGRGERTAGLRLLEQLDQRAHPRPRMVLADNGFAQPVMAARAAAMNVHLQIGQMPGRPPKAPIPDGLNAGFRLIPVRWIVERTNAWMSSCRRLNREHERTTASRTAMAWIAATRVALRRLA